MSVKRPYLDSSVVQTDPSRVVDVTQTIHLWRNGGVFGVRLRGEFERNDKKVVEEERRRSLVCARVCVFE